jgi:hypothetical protein
MTSPVLLLRLDAVGAARIVTPPRCARVHFAQLDQ